MLKRKSFFCLLGSCVDRKQTRMKAYCLIFPLIPLFTEICGQEKQNQIDGIEQQNSKMRVSEIQQYYEQEETQDYTEYINPAIDTFFNIIIKQNFEDLYAMTAIEVKERQSKEDFILYYDLCYKYFGRPKKYGQTSFRIMNNPMGKGKSVSATFDIEFEKCPGKGSTIFNIIDRDTIRLQMFTLSLKKYTKIEKLHSISGPTMKAIREKDNEVLYALTSQRFKENNSFSDLQSLTKEIFELDLSDCRIFNYTISVDDGHERIISAFEVNNSSGILQLVHTKMDGRFHLNGLKYITKREILHTTMKASTGALGQHTWPGCAVGHHFLGAEWKTINFRISILLE